MLIRAQKSSLAENEEVQDVPDAWGRTIYYNQGTGGRI